MCGIVGIFSANRTVDKGIVEVMNEALHRRGPDDAGFYQSEGINLGMRRLSIIDVENGRQPVYSEDGKAVIVFNGEIYNHNELRDSLIDKGFTFKSKSDTEVIINLYQLYGIDCLNYLRGMFGLCIWDIQRKKGYLCRDHFGIKPIFTSITEDNKLLFSSEIKGIMASGFIDREICLEGLDSYLAYNYIPAPLTIYKSIKKLPPAHYIEFDSHSISDPVRYWDANELSNAAKHTESEIESAIKSSVKHHMESDVPVGAFLSGGIDSALVTAMASKNERFHSAYTIGFNVSSHLYDERPLAQLVTKSLGIERHKIINVDPDPEEALRGAVSAFDEPFADDSIIPTWEICKIASRDLKVCLSGLGGDELFGGYYRYLGIKLYERYSLVPRIFRRIVRSVGKSLIPESGSRKIDHFLRFLDASVLPADDAYVSYITSLSKSRRKDLYSNEIRDSVDYTKTEALIKNHFNRSESKSLLKKAIYTDINAYVPEDILALSDRVSMHHSLELRVPLMDRVLFSHCCNIPDKLMITWSEKKILLRKIARNYLPQSLFGMKKQGFESPMAKWINSDLSEFVNNTLSEKALGEHNFFNKEYVGSLISDHRKEVADNSKIIFSLLMFQLWYEGER